MEEKKDDKLVKRDCLEECDNFKNKLEICMKNSDNNIIQCQDLRNNYENCLIEMHKKESNNIYNQMEDISLTN